MKNKVYLLPGTMCNQRLWHKVFNCAKPAPSMENLAQVQTTSLDNIEFIHIPIPTNKNIKQLASWLNEYFQEESVCLAGFSLGGYIASYFAVHYPERVKSVFVIANSPCALTAQEVLQRGQLLAYINQSKTQYQGISTKRAKQLLDKDTNHSSQEQDILTIKQMDAELGVDELISQMTYTTQRDDLLQAMSALNIPMTFYYSEHDSLINKTWLQQLSDNNTHCKLLPTSGSSHMLPLEKPQQLTDLIVDWFS